MTDIIDPAAIARLKRIGGTDLARQMIALFLEQGAERIARATAAFAAGDVGGIEHAAHSLKSSAGNIGALRVQRAAEETELAAEAGDMMKIGTMVDGMCNEYTAAATALNGFLVELDQ